VIRKSFDLLVFENSAADPLNDSNGSGLFSREKEICIQDCISFANFSFLALPCEAKSLPSRGGVRKYPKYPTDRIRIIQGIDHLISEEVDVINLSFGPPFEKFDEKDPLQIAVRIATEKGIPVVVAAGNEGKKEGRGSLQALAQAPWVIAVGATDAEGNLLESSSRGICNGPCPTIVCDGATHKLSSESSALPPSTSFAAPKISGIAAWISKCFGLIFDNLRDQQSGMWTLMSKPVKFPLIGIIDTGVGPNEIPSLSPLASSFISRGIYSVSLVRPEEEKDWYQAVVGGLKELGLKCTLTAGPATVKRAIEMMAKPMPGYGPCDVGAGFVSIREAEIFMATLTPSRFIQLFCPQKTSPEFEETFASLDRKPGPLWNVENVEVLENLLYDGILLSIVKAL